MDFKLPAVKVSQKLVKCIFLSSSAAFAGMGTTLSLVATPAVLASSDPLPSWRLLYGRGKNIAITCILTTAVTGIHIFYKKGDLRYLVCAGLSLLVIPYTIKFMKPTNDALFALKGSNPEQTKVESKRLLTTWSGLQWVRTALGVAVFAIGVNAVVYK